MTSWTRNAIVLTTIAAQVLAGALSGRAIYLSHCGEHAHSACEDHHHDDCDLGGDGCLASLSHGHLDLGLGHDHRCHCAHFHVPGEMQRADRSRLRESLRAPVSLPVPKCVQVAQESLGPFGGASLHASLPDDAGPPQTARAIRSIRLLV